jgi:tetratricopeptide (TPR) repeat protein
MARQRRLPHRRWPRIWGPGKAQTSWRASAVCPTAGGCFILRAAVTDSRNADALSQRGLELLANAQPSEAAQAFRDAIAANPAHVEAHHGLIRALRDAGQLNQSVAAAMALSVLTPDDPLAHAALSIALQHAGHIPQAEAAAGRARILEWKKQLESPQNGPTQGEAEFNKEFAE